MRSLLWKEWHEQAWKLAFGCLLMGMFALVGLRTRMMADAAMISWICLLALLLLPTMAAAGLIPAERDEGTLEMLLALPITPRRVLLSKTIVGVLLCVGPLLTAMAISLWAASGREMSAAAIIRLYAQALAAALSLFAWMFALTSRLPSEARAGLICLGVLVFWMLASFGLAKTEAPPALRAVCPFSFTVAPLTDPFFERSAGNVRYLFRAYDVSFVAALFVQIAVAGGLWLWAAARLAAPIKERP